MGGVGERSSHPSPQWRRRLRRVPLRTRGMGRRSPHRGMGERRYCDERARALWRFVASAGRAVYQSSLISWGGPAAKASCHRCRTSWFLGARRRVSAWRRAMRRPCSAAPSVGGTRCPRRWRGSSGGVLPHRHDEPRAALDEHQGEVLRRGWLGDVHAPLPPRQRRVRPRAAQAARAGRVREVHGASRRLDGHPVARASASAGREAAPRMRKLDVRERDALGRRAHRRGRKRKGV